MRVSSRSSTVIAQFPALFFQIFPRRKLRRQEEDCVVRNFKELESSSSRDKWATHELLDEGDMTWLPYKHRTQEGKWITHLLIVFYPILLSWPVKTVFFG